MSKVRLFLHILGRNGLTIFGGSLATVSAFAVVIMLGLTVSGAIHDPYVGLIVIVVLPGMLFIGLVCIPLGLWLDRRQRLKLGVPAAPSPEHPWPIIDFNNPKTRDVAKVVSALTLVNVVIASVVSYQGVVHSGSTEFCGLTCHTVMEPQYTAFLDSAHANTACVACHVGPGASGFVSAKLAGVRQLYEVLTGTYPTPIYFHRDHMLPASKTCERCHTPAAISGDSLKVWAKYLADENNSVAHTVLLMRLGDAASDTGIHGWHLNPERAVAYQDADPSDELIDAVRVTGSDGDVTEYRLEGAAAVAAPWRVMDCNDCHNRAGHAFHSPETALDALFTRGELDPGLPRLKAAAVDALSAAADGTDGDASAKLLAFYEQAYPELVEARKEDIAKAASAVHSVFKRNVFPKMKVDWNTYPDYRGHVGCFRCHDDSHKAADGRVIRQDCALCHNVLAWDESGPEILNQLGLALQD